MLDQTLLLTEKKSTKELASRMFTISTTDCGTWKHINDISTWMQTPENWGMSCQSTVYTHGLSSVTCWRLGVNQDNKTSHFKPESFLVFLLSFAGLLEHFYRFSPNGLILDKIIKENRSQHWDQWYVNIDRRAGTNDSTCFSAPGAKAIICKPATVKRTMIKRQYFHHQEQKTPKHVWQAWSLEYKGIN